MAYNGRTVLFRNIAPRTTEKSIRDYLHEYAVTYCTVPTNDQQFKNGFAKVTFATVEDVNRLMSKRPHTIDGARVFVHRRVLTAQSVRDGYKITYLALFGVPNECSKEELIGYFRKYGTILDIWLEDESKKSWVIHFDDYDSVDRVLLDQPHVIRNSATVLEKGRLYYHRQKSTMEDNLKPTDGNKSPDAPRIHVTNLPTTITASDLSSKFDCHVQDILMKPSTGDILERSECWLLKFKDDATIDQFISQWNHKIIGGLRIHCQKEYFPLELCKYFQTGRCSKSDQDCFWQHVPCPSERCSYLQCQFGHQKGTWKIWPNSMDNQQHYRVKVIGLPSITVSYSMGRIFQKEDKYCLRDPKNQTVGYVYFVSIKMAQLFISKWHGIEFEGEPLAFQLEKEPTILEGRSHSLSAMSEHDGSETSQNENLSSPHNNVPRIKSAVDFTDTPTKRFDDGLLSNRFNDDETGRERRMLGPALGKARAKVSNFPNPSGVATETTANTIPRELFDQWTVDARETKINTRLLRFLSGSRDRLMEGVLKRYPILNDRRYIRESTALTALKGMPCVSKLLQSSDTNSEESWIVMNRAVGSTLRAEMNKLGQNSIDLRQSIEIVQHIIQILQTIHKKQVFHQNLSPDHIIIDRNSVLNPSFRQAPIVLISFSQAQTKQDEVSDNDEAEQSKFWYNARQKNDLQYRATIDASCVCAILLWLMTGIQPSANDSNPFHEQNGVHEKIESIAKASIGHQGGNEQIIRLKMYLMNTFDRSFGYPDYPLWTLSDLQLRLESIYEFVSLSFRRSENQSYASLLDKILDIDRQEAIRSAAGRESERGMILERAAEAIDQAKQAFAHHEANRFHWSIDRCEWVDISNASKGTRSFPIIISFMIKISDDDQQVSMTMMTSVNGKEVQIPIIYRENQKNFTENFNEKFINEIKLLISIFSKEYQIRSK